MQHTKEVLVAIGLTITIAVITGAVLGGSSISQAQTEELEIKEIKLTKGSSGDAQLKVTIKNGGNSSIDTITGQLNFDTDTNTPAIDPFTFVFTPTTLEPGASTVYVGDVTESSVILMGQYFTLSVNGITQQGSVIQDTGIASVSRF